MKRIPPPILMFAGLGCEWLLSRFVPLVRLDRAPERWLGYAAIASGVVLALTAFAMFVKARTTPVPHGVPRVLVASGPFRVTRNPMYLGLVLILLGAAPQFGGASAVAIPFLFGALVSSVFIPPEEQAMLTQFGADYRDYSTRVRRWI
jgi:protein-S-isoprenylcysteine O-methyltransferase Ste14